MDQTQAHRLQSGKGGGMAAPLKADGSDPGGPPPEWQGGGMAAPLKADGSNPGAPPPEWQGGGMAAALKGASRMVKAAKDVLLLYGLRTSNSELQNPTPNPELR